ncbi:MAG: bifunctional sulfate adenylyltransferase/adenylylsulfate kinase [Acidobacteriota bacterium]
MTDFSDPPAADSFSLIAPHGGALVDLMAAPDRAAALRAEQRDLPSWVLTQRQMLDLELLMVGGFSPLRGFQTAAEVASVCESMRLPDGALWPIPVTLDIEPSTAERLEVGGRLALLDGEGVMLAVLHVEDLWEPDIEALAEATFGTRKADHPGVRHLLTRSNRVAVGGRIEGVERPQHYDFAELRHTPAALRAWLAGRGWSRIVAFQTRNPMHRAHFEMTLRAAQRHDAKLLIHPVVGATKAGDLDHYTRVRCYRKVLARYPGSMVELSLLPLAMRMAGPREALWHAIVRKNYGCSHFIVGRDHAGPGLDAQHRPFYPPYAAQELLRRHQDELGVELVAFERMVYVEERDGYLPASECPPETRPLDLSGSELRRRLDLGLEIPTWFTFPEIADELRRSRPPRGQRGFTVFFTGLSGAGKSTLAKVLLARLLEVGERSVTLLDGDIVRRHLSSELGFSKEHRDINVRRIGFVASEITKNRGIALCAPIAPYDAVRREVREMVEERGGFVLVHVATPLDVCADRDRKGLYAAARAGRIKGFTGIDDPYEEPADAELVIDTAECTPDEAVDRILEHLEEEGYLQSAAAG